jgi:hypothetical protein
VAARIEATQNARDPITMICSVATYRIAFVLMIAANVSQIVRVAKDAALESKL